MKIAILGAGLMGSKLGRLWAAGGHDVTFAYSRSADKLARLARDAGATSGTVAEAVAGADAILLAVHWSRIGDVLAQAGDLEGRVVLNCCVPLNEANDALVLGPETSGAEELAAMRPGAAWVSCFNTSPSEAFDPVFSRKNTEPRPHLLIYGDNDGAKELAGGLIRDIGFDPLDAGGLATGRYAEPFAMVTAVLAYGQPGGPALTYRFDKLS
ncbi:NADP oxidoreductase coenzyme F420-dependent [Roseivivax jejudonensis]|uniref:NADP oxidoreductase coenzyme F420-dependent n=1 Tax=Roseivivax jejudonensis TaxID=1529041 RepID=A0A1X6Y3P7_9RHOB|nr:NAD(P)-binding domain-containing protein [Roseivivax jejudonensis]SLN09736.1 NADP oxidoreductase coenzyme F420-dependent [Roseivivax jejudonensis]